ncbi:MAG: hypothetical protein IJP62_12185 [Treponema sp.]|nr:hypothetical protein [Treponema sp.]
MEKEIMIYNEEILDRKMNEISAKLSEHDKKFKRVFKLLNKIQLEMLRADFKPENSRTEDQ